MSHDTWHLYSSTHQLVHYTLDLFGSGTLSVPVRLSSGVGLPNISFDLPYRSRSPVLFETVEYETKQDILDEVYRVLEEADERGYDIGQSLYYQLPFFCSPAFIISDIFIYPDA